MKIFTYRFFLKYYILLSVIFCGSSFSQNLFERETLTGDWGGIRTDLANKGITFEAVYTGEILSNLKGGLQQKTTYLDNVDLILSLNTEKLFSWYGSKVFIYGIGDNGGKPNEFVGDAQGVSNIEAFSTWKIYEAWIQQNLFKNKLSLLAGLYDLNSEFQVLESSSLFINSSHGIGIEFSQSGVNGPSIFPTTSLGVRLKWNATDNFYIQTVLLNGIAGDPDNPYGTRITFPKNSGVLSTTEFQYLFYNFTDQKANFNRKDKNRLGRLAVHNYRGKIGLGIWIYSAKFPELLSYYSPPNLISGNSGFYFIGEYKIFDEPSDFEQGLRIFTRVGFANSKINRFASYSGAGMVYRGLLPGRDNDEFGIALSGAHNGASYKNLLANDQIPVKNSEWNIEIIYSLNLFPWFNLNPDFQYIINPNTDPQLKNPLTFDLRFIINL